MDFYLNIATITQAIKVYLNTYQTLEERERTRNTTVTELNELGWSGTACDAFMEAHEQKMQLYAKLKEDILYMINALQEEKQRALMLKMRCEDFVNCIERTGQGGAITGDDEGILSLDFSSQGKINNYVNNCVDDDYVTLNSNFSKIQDILGSLEYTSFGIEGDVDTLINSVKDQTESLTEFDDSFNVYYAGVKDMESNICSVFSKISASGYSPFQNSSVLAPNGEISTNNLVNAALKTESLDTLANANITNGMNLENLSYEVDNDIESDSSQKPTSLWDKFWNNFLEVQLKQQQADYDTQQEFSQAASGIWKGILWATALQEQSDEEAQQQYVNKYVTSYATGVYDDLTKQITGLWDSITKYSLESYINEQRLSFDPTYQLKVIETVSTEIYNAFTKEVINGDGEDWAHFAGETSSEIATFFFGGKAIGKIGDIVKGADEASEIGKVEKAAVDSTKEIEEIGNKLKPSNSPNPDATPSGTKTKIPKKADKTTKRSLERENEAADILAQNGYDIEQNPTVEDTTRNPDYRVEGELVDCYSPEEETSTRSIGSTIKGKVIEKKQANRIVLNLKDWGGNVSDIVDQLNTYPIEGLEEVIVIEKDNSVVSIYP